MLFKFKHVQHCLIVPEVIYRTRVALGTCTGQCFLRSPSQIEPELDPDPDSDPGANFILTTACMANMYECGTYGIISYKLQQPTCLSGNEASVQRSGALYQLLSGGFVSVSKSRRRGSQRRGEGTRYRKERKARNYADADTFYGLLHAMLLRRG